MAEKNNNIEAVYLNIDGLFVYQNKDGYTLSSDAVALANYAKCKDGDIVVDLCSGSGIVGILFSLKNKPKMTYLIELQKSMCDLANRSIKENKYQNIECINSDIKDLKSVFSDSSVDVITVNPPYYKSGEGKLSSSDEINIARHEIKVTLEDIIKESSRLLKSKGIFYMITITKRLYEVLSLTKKYNLGAREIKLIYPENKNESNVFLIKAQKGYSGETKFLK